MISEDVKKKMEQNFCHRNKMFNIINGQMEESTVCQIESQV